MYALKHNYMRAQMKTQRAIRKSGYTQDELAELLHMSRGHFNKKLHGRDNQRFTPEDINTLALYGVPIAELYPDAEPIETQS